jgi:hypothetical protein
LSPHYKDTPWDAGDDHRQSIRSEPASSIDMHHIADSLSNKEEEWLENKQASMFQTHLTYPFPSRSKSASFLGRGASAVGKNRRAGQRLYSALQLVLNTPCCDRRRCKGPRPTSGPVTNLPTAQACSAHH